MEEIWQDIKGYEGLYQVSNTGKVKSLEKTYFKLGRKMIYKEKELKSLRQNNGYYAVNLYKNGNSKILLIHRLVAETFIEKPIGKNVVNHIDYDTSNNSVENLEWTTQKENLAHSKENIVKAYLKKRMSNTNEHYIYKNRKTILFRYQPMNICKSFKTIKEALQYREKVLGF